MTKRLVLSLLIFTTISYQEHAIGAGDELIQQPNIAFACRDCTLADAEAIAREKAPINDCDIYRNGPVASFCEAVTQEILIPVTNTKYVYKFITSTTIDSLNRPVVNLFSFPLTSDQTNLMNMFFDFYEGLQAAIQNASIHDLEMSPSPSYAMHVNGSGASDGDECESHPTKFFRGINEKRAIRSELAARVTTAMSGSTAVEFTQESLLGGGGINFGTTGAGISVSVQYFEVDQIVTRGTDFNNRLAFDVNISGDATRNNLAVFNLSLNTEFTKIDGFKYYEIFGSEVDLEGVGISNCLREYFEEESEAIPEDQMPESGGSGTYNDPFTGADAFSNTNPQDLCKYNRRVKTCSTTKEGTTCTYTQVSWLNSCGQFGNN
ncbi:hypothetical protein [Thalassotalea piscium]|uniref:Uncharacterized protein n=1 Tax=Thalassotalea piscium TaxID=1230533 RepID=A0A7X0TV76_9GAMM|nr:hypothetical protein [Thalassotalea piscium]MBB6544963.1 hypothetical protein [Thalassotalea piscium]